MKNVVCVKLVGAGVLLTLLVSIFSAIGVVSGAGIAGMLGWQILAFAIAAFSLLLFLKQKQLLSQIFNKNPRRLFAGGIFLSLLIILVQPLIFGVDMQLGVTIIGLIIMQMFLVGFSEEVLFRGIFYHYLSREPKKFITFSSIAFGLLHVASGINPSASLLLVSLQILNALSLGVLFAVLYVRLQNIYLLIIFHALFNIGASICQPASDQKNILAVCLLLVLYLVFLGVLKKTRLKN